MSLQRKFMLIFVTATMISVTFLVYAAYVYFNAYTLTHGLRISILDVNLIRQDSSSFLETVFLLENPSKLHLNIGYVQQKVYLDSHYKVRVDDRHHNYLGGSDKCVALVPPFSNDSLRMRIRLIEDFPSNDSNIWFLVYMRIIDVPLVRAVYLELPLSWSF